MGRGTERIKKNPKIQKVIENNERVRIYFTEQTGPSLMMPSDVNPDSPTGKTLLKVSAAASSHAK
jgi:hypothetical protein